jgi:hypothetical protein
MKLYHNISLLKIAYSRTFFYLPCTLAAWISQEMFQFNPHTNNWTVIPTSEASPSPRNRFGMVATLDGIIYIFGGTATCKH